MVPVFVFNVRFTKEGLHLVQDDFGLKRWVDDKGLSVICFSVMVKNMNGGWWCGGARMVVNKQDGQPTAGVLACWPLSRQQKKSDG